MRLFQLRTATRYSQYNWLVGTESLFAFAHLTSLNFPVIVMEDVAGGEWERGAAIVPILFL